MSCRSAASQSTERRSLVRYRSGGRRQISEQAIVEVAEQNLLVDATGIPLAWALTGGNRHAVTRLIPLVDRVPPVRDKAGRPRRRPGRLTAEHGSGLGRHRSVVERTFARLRQLKRLLVRYGRRYEIHEVFLALGCCLVCFRRLQNSF